MTAAAEDKVEPELNVGIVCFCKSWIHLMSQYWLGDVVQMQSRLEGGYGMQR